MRLIDADALKDKARELIPNYHASVVMNLFDLIDNLADNMPTVDAEPVRHGRWVEENPLNVSACRLIKCSECGISFIVPVNVPYEDWVEGRNFCYSCGARMDEK